MKFKSFTEKDENSRKDSIEKFSQLAQFFVDSDSIQEYLVKRDQYGEFKRCNFFDIFYVAWWKREHATALKTAKLAFICAMFLSLFLSFIAAISMFALFIIMQFIAISYNSVYLRIMDYVKDAKKGSLYLELHDQMNWF